MNMKKYIWMSVAALALASCSQNDELVQSGEGLATTHVVFTANVESGMKTRAVTDPTDDSPTRALLEIYDASGTRVGDQIPGELNSEGTAFTFRADLDGLQTYTCAFWADADDGKYNTTSLKSISYSNINDKQQGIAFSAKCEINPAENKNVSVTLTHSVAKLVLHETGTGLKANDVVGVTFTRPNYTFDASSQTYTEDATATGTDLDLSYTVVSDGETGDLAAAYMLVPASILVDKVNLYYNTAEHSKSITNVPLKTNHRTLLRGAFEDLATSAPSQTFNITCDMNWENETEQAFTTTVNQDTHTITLAEAGSLSPATIASAMGETGILKVKGKINQDDIQSIIDAAKYTITELDLSEASGDDVSIPLSAFFGNSNNVQLKVVKLGSNVTEIQRNAFTSCASLTEVDLSKCTNLTAIGYGAFGMCDITDLKLPENGKLSAIDATTFYDNQNLQTVSIPATVEQLSHSIFIGCTSLTTIIFQGTEAPAMVNTGSGTNTFAGCVEKGNENTIIYLPNVTAETDAWKTFFGEANGWTIKYGESPAVNP